MYVSCPLLHASIFSQLYVCMYGPLSRRKHRKHSTELKKSTELRNLDGCVCHVENPLNSSKKAANPLQRV